MEDEAENEEGEIGGNGARLGLPSSFATEAYLEASKDISEQREIKCQQLSDCLQPCPDVVFLPPPSLRSLRVLRLFPSWLCSRKERKKTEESYPSSPRATAAWRMVTSKNAQVHVELGKNMVSEALEDFK